MWKSILLGIIGLGLHIFVSHYELFYEVKNKSILKLSKSAQSDYHHDRLDIFLVSDICLLSSIFHLKRTILFISSFHALVHINCATLLMTDKPLVEKDVSHTR